MGIDMTQHDHLNQFIVGKTLFLSHVASSLLAKSIGVFETLSWLKERFIRMRLVEKTDTLLVKQCLEENLLNYSYFDSLIFYCKTLIKGYLFTLCRLLRNQRIRLLIILLDHLFMCLILWSEILVLRFLLLIYLFSIEIIHKSLI